MNGQMNPKLKLSKLDCARRQLEMAIELYFMERDPVSVHTLIGAVRQLLTDISKHRGGKPLFTDIEALKGVVIPGKEKELSKLFKKPQNFLNMQMRMLKIRLIFLPKLTKCSFGKPVLNIPNLHPKALQQ